MLQKGATSNPLFFPLIIRIWLLGTLADLATTYVGTQYFQVFEINRFVQEFGIGVGLGAIAALQFILILILWKLVAHVRRANYIWLSRLISLVLITLFWTAPINNIYYILVA